MNKLIEYIKEKIRKEIKRWVNKHLKKVIDDIDNQKNNDTNKPEPQNCDETDFSQMDFCYGGFNGSNACFDERVKIKNLRVYSSKMTYSWVEGCSLKAWGLEPGKAKALACIFFKDSKGNWKGGKFDWISTNRLSRDFSNINSGYNNWDPSGFNNALEFAFCIVSENRKYRSNLIIFNKEGN